MSLIIKKINTILRIHPTDNETLRTVASLIMENFGRHHKPARRWIDVTWSEAFEIEVVAEDPRLLDDLEVVCWYMFRDMVLASLIRVKTKMLISFRLDLRVPPLPRPRSSLRRVYRKWASDQGTS